MPNKAFINLSKTKKEMLEKAALEEFSEYTYDQISINRIIQSIKMPRGSFYLYFNDKEDLYLYIFSKYHNIILELLVSSLKETNDIIETYQLLFKKIVKYCDSGDHKELLRHFFVGLNHNIENKVVKLMTCEPSIDIIKLFKEKYTDKLCDDLNINDVADILTNVLIHSLTNYYILKTDLDIVTERFNNQINIIKKGIYK